VSFDNAISFLGTYRTERAKALNNEQRQGWSTTPLESVDQIFSADYFSSTEENDAWDEMRGDDGDATTLEFRGVQLKIAFLAGCHRDLRMIFAAGAGNRIRTPLDQDRFEYMKLAFHQAKTEVLQQVAQSQSPDEDSEA